MKINKLRSQLARANVIGYLISLLFKLNKNTVTGVSQCNHLGAAINIILLIITYYYYYNYYYYTQQFT